MTSRDFFALVWRINAVVILVVGVLGVVVLLFTAASIYKETTRSRQTAGVLNIAEEEVDLVEASLGEFEIVQGTDVLRAPLYLKQGYSFGSGSKEATSTRNYLHYNSTTQEAYWLIPGNRGLILEAIEHPPRAFGEKERSHVVAVAYLLVDDDSNQDGKLTRNDRQTLAVSDPEGKRFARLVTGIEVLNGAHLTGSGTLLLLFTSETSLQVAEVDLATNKLIRQSVVKPLKDEAQRQAPAEDPASRQPG